MIRLCGALFVVVSFAQASLFHLTWLDYGTGCQRTSPWSDGRWCGVGTGEQAVMLLVAGVLALGSAFLGAWLIAHAPRASMWIRSRYHQAAMPWRHDA